jgi:hypothetical protein
VPTRLVRFKPGLRVILDECPARDERDTPVLISGEFIVSEFFDWLEPPRDDGFDDDPWEAFYTLDRPDDGSVRRFVKANDLGPHMRLEGIDA